MSIALSSLRFMITPADRWHGPARPGFLTGVCATRGGRLVVVASCLLPLVRSFGRHGTRFGARRTLVRHWTARICDSLRADFGPSAKLAAHARGCGDNDCRFSESQFGLQTLAQYRVDRRHHDRLTRYRAPG
jgi:hypothetical protein